MATIVRWNPIREMAAMQSAMDRLFEENRRAVRAAASAHTLPLDVYETDQAYTLYASLPGVNPEEIQISVEDDVLTIRASVPAPAFAEGENARALMRERRQGSFERSVRIPEPVAAEQVEAAYDAGILKLTLPKTPAAQPRTIPVRATSSMN